MTFKELFPDSDKVDEVLEVGVDSEEESFAEVPPDKGAERDGRLWKLPTVWTTGMI